MATDPVPTDEELARLYRSMPPEFWADFVRTLAFALAGGRGHFVCRVDLVDVGQVGDWENTVSAKRRPMKVRKIA